MICAPSLDVLADADNAVHTELAISRNWFRDAAIPLFFAIQLPGTQFLHQGPAQIEGEPDWAALIRLPQRPAISRLGG